MNSWQDLLLISAALKTGLMQSLVDKEKTAAELAAEKNYDLRATEIVMEALRELSLVTEVRAHYRLTAAAFVFVDENDPNFTANSYLHSARLIENWTKLEQAIKTGKSQSRRRSAAELEIFVKSMDEYSKHYAGEAISLILKEKSDAKNALDLGGALGTFSKPMVAAGVEVTLLDTPAVIEVAKNFLKDTPVKLLAGDFNRELPPGPFDIVLLSNITHIYNPDKLEGLFSKVSSALSEKGIVGIIDFVREKSAGAAMFAVNMLVHTAGGGTWTLPQYERWLRHGGLRLKKINDLENAEQKLLFARRHPERKC